MALAYPVFVLNLLTTRARNLREEKKKNSIGCLYENIKIKRKTLPTLQYLYSYFFLFRRLCYILIIITLAYDPIYQHALNILLHLLMVIWNFTNRPFSDRIQAILTYVFDLSVFLIFATLPLFFIESWSSSHQLIGLIIIILILACLALGWLVIVFVLGVSFVRFIKKKLREKKESRKKALSRLKKSVVAKLFKKRKPIQFKRKRKKNKKNIV